MKILWRFLALVVPVLAVASCLWAWIGQPVSDQELLANFAKAGDFFRGIQSLGSWPWWSPMFQQGTSLAPAWGVMLSNALLLAGAGVFGFLTGSKVAVAVCLLGGATGMFFFLRRWTGNLLAAASKFPVQRRRKKNIPVAPPSRHTATATLLPVKKPKTPAPASRSAFESMTPQAGARLVPC